MIALRTAAAIAAAFMIAAAGWAAPGPGPASEGLLGDWPLPAHGYDGNRYVITSQLDRQSVKRLRRAWTFSVPDDAMMETAPVIVGGTVYVTSGHDDVYALDARSGAKRWSFAYPRSHVIGIAANRGVGYLDGRLFLGTLDGHVLALDAATGNVLWNVAGVHDPENSFYTMAPLPYRDVVMIGVSNGDWGGAGYVTAFDVASGKRVWEWQTIPARGKDARTWGGASGARGGGAVWGGLTLDAASGTLYIDVGNPEPDLNGAVRPGANLYTDAMVALDVRSRAVKMKWYRQFIPHDTHDWDPAMPPVRFTGIVSGTPRELVAAGDKGGTFWVLDARDGALVERLAVSTQSEPAPDSSADGAVACPGTNGGVQYNGGAFLPETNAFYVPSIDQCQLFTASGTAVPYVPGELYLGGTVAAAGEMTGWMNAIDIATGQALWRKKLPLPALGGALAVSSGIVFSGQMDGALNAYDAANGAVLWSAKTGAPIKAPPSAYLADGKPYVIVASGPPGRNFAVPGVPAAEAGIVSAFTLP